MEREIEELREYYKSGKTQEISWRRSQLKGLQALLKDQKHEIFKALYQDLGKHHIEAFRDEVGFVSKSTNFALENLKEWMSPKKAVLPKIALFSSAEVVPEPLGLVLIISPWNFPIELSLQGLIGAIAGGNTVVLKPSEIAPASSALLAKIIPTYLDNKAVKVIQGGPQISQNLLQLKWDKIFFTGSGRVGRIVMSEAAKTLTPVGLELGGKCPAIVDSFSSSWDTQAVVNRIIGAKYGCAAGQACIAIDYVLVDKKFVSYLVKQIKVAVIQMFGEKPREINSIARIVNKHQFLRLKSYLDDQRVKDSVIYGGSFDEENLFIEPTVLLDPPLDAEIMREEIFGPLLPIITLENIEDAVGFIRVRPKPLTIYAFTHNEALRNKILYETSSGSVVFNDALVQAAADTLPFGGIGESGIGKGHGKYSFDSFSHYKAVVRRNLFTEFWFRFPPWTESKYQLLDRTYKYDYFGILLVVLGLYNIPFAKFSSVCVFFLVCVVCVLSYFYV